LFFTESKTSPDALKTVPKGTGFLQEVRDSNVKKIKLIINIDCFINVAANSLLYATKIIYCIKPAKYASVKAAKRYADEVIATQRQIVQKLKSKNKDDLYTSFQISNQSS